jgi:hypothetical protein
VPLEVELAAAGRTPELPPAVDELETHVASVAPAF